MAIKKLIKQLLGRLGAALFYEAVLALIEKNERLLVHTFSVRERRENAHAGQAQRSA